MAPPAPNWVDEAFLWTISTLALLSIMATVPPPGAWPSVDFSLPSGFAPASAPRAKPLVSFSDPVPGYPVVSPFGLRQLPWEEHGRLHQGVDIAAPAGSPVLAVADGVVEREGVDAGYGRFIEVRHAAGLSTLYGHLQAFDPAAQEGAPVRQGQPIGRIGSTGSSTGAHLHLELHDQDGRPLDPQRFLGRAFASAADLPLKAAARFPRGVRVAFVSFIPPSKRELMEQRAEQAAAEDDAAIETAPPAPIEPSPTPVVPTPVSIQRPMALAAAAVAVPAPIQAGEPAPRVHMRIESPSN